MQKHKPEELNTQKMEIYYYLLQWHAMIIANTPSHATCFGTTMSSPGEITVILSQIISN
jgi:hypothetical protein